MHFKTAALLAIAVCTLAATTAAHAEVQADCHSVFFDITYLSGPDQDRLIFGIKARDWTRDDVDRLFDIYRGCVRTGDYPESMRKVMLQQIENSRYPNAIRALEERDRRLQQANAAAAQQAQAAQATVERQQQQEAAQQQQAQAEAQRRASIEAANRQRQEQDARDQLERQQQQQRAEAQASQQRNLWIVVGMIAAAVAAWGWNRFIRNRCPKCKSTSINLVNEQEIDRWRGSKRVTETHSRGTNTRHVSATYVRTQFDYRCKHCHQEWTKTRQEELGSNSALIRFLAGY